MQKRIPIKNHHQEILLIAKRTMLVSLLILLLILGLITRLAYLQIHKNAVYSTLSTKNWLDLVPIEPTRGLIFDRNGVLLAENIPVFSLDILPFQVSNLPKTISELSKIISLSSNDISQFRKQLKQHRRFDEIPLKLKMTEEEVARFAENQHRFPGVKIQARLIRHYPYASSFSHVMGYVGRINSQDLAQIDQINYSASHYIGKLGIEKYYEDVLHGQVGYEQVEIDASGKPLRVLKEIKGAPGNNIYLTLDSGLQFAAEKALKGHRGAVVAIQPSTGQVLAMVSEPGYDPNTFVIGINKKDYQELLTSENRPLYDRALRGLYPLASAIKPYLALHALNEGVTTADLSLSDPGFFQLKNNSHRFHDSRKQGHGRVNLAKAITTSCDIYFYDLGYKMGIRRINDVLNQFGFGQVTGIDLIGEVGGVVANPDWKRKFKGLHWYEGDTILSSIGQGYMQATPLQLAVATATLANRGQRFLPYLLLSKQTSEGFYQPQAVQPLDKINVNDPRHWEVVIRAMQEAVTSSTGTANRFGKKHTYTVAAKTGTAQVSRRRNPDEADKQDALPEKLRDHHLFIAFAPVDHPKIALAIVTENSDTAIETARIVMDYYLK